MHHRDACCGSGKGQAVEVAAKPESHRSDLVRVLPHEPPADAADKPDDADEQGKQAQRPFQIVGRKCVEDQDKPDCYET